MPRNTILFSAKRQIAGLLLVVSLPALAHHSFFAEFDANRPLVLEGTIKEMRWQNPHSWLVMDVVNSQGEHEEWMVEGGSPNVLIRLGWNRNSLPTGTKVVVQGFGAKDGAKRASSTQLEFPDGRVLETGGGRN
ncbi:MAG: hypothetical protein LBF16_00950 [Pseudomonadales bacterium]|jgi:hypothetical protein|nr:hypothetical protein [Pseudomonadales bacterium]